MANIIPNSSGEPTATANQARENTLNARIIGTAITDQPLEPLREEAQRLVPDATAGAVVTFDGIIRNHDHGHSVDVLVYTAHPSAEKELSNVVADIAAEYPDVRLWAAHRTGKLGIGELAFAVVVASAHRKEAFAACAELADRVKTTVPIWKEQFLTDGSTQWVGLD
ncbi:molybdenum cofactor biosynthesis protein MoaE [Corynebacterium pseudodiphtheriticum]|uniref:molybdenum cofactor biosynthesis protein MoaE n=1 Tax=Corynebacterium pseudodiphtheriticum TaxID=37637 RepID=UPI00254C91B1|nr:molybdenum cofactor biosynthesis protein MoaE [Corynebacterium pseudodiphtheriticum]MDK8500216.1 molybdenum cofactor biosynthesis protein MoaE [Corynebacterium pseudodiphtheriticum]MDK8584184.1 molybdenum cofactor biosynthesis protein MoaE [Corynebacterium pseudodiphtheriticum]MDK8839810.1 molybdenum cofactor biosynthesis protein MoaE [Corynebacterium pseudodiphtheriticum]